MTPSTDWDRYYRNTPRYTSVTRAISARKVIGLIEQHASTRPLNICEIGGANSCFVEAICDRIAVSHYHVVDSNEYGLNLLAQKRVAARLTSEMEDVLSQYRSPERYDLVYSVGLIEHFDLAGTRRAIGSHFDRCKPGGLVLMTFPTPTFLYRSIRGVAEATGRWAFPDERPLTFDEVIASCQARGDVLHQSINWVIGLTQGYVMTRAR